MQRRVLQLDWYMKCMVEEEMTKGGEDIKGRREEYSGDDRPNFDTIVLEHEEQIFREQAFVVCFF